MKTVTLLLSSILSISAIAAEQPHIPIHIPVSLPNPSAFPATSVMYQWDWTCGLSSGCDASGFGVPAGGNKYKSLSIFLVAFPTGSNQTTLTYFTYATNASGQEVQYFTQVPAQFQFQETGMILTYAGNPNQPAPTVK